MRKQYFGIVFLAALLLGCGMTNTKLDTEQATLLAKDTMKEKYAKTFDVVDTKKVNMQTGTYARYEYTVSMTDDNVDFTVIMAEDGTHIRDNYENELYADSLNQDIQSTLVPSDMTLDKLVISPVYTDKKYGTFEEYKKNIGRDLRVSSTYGIKGTDLEEISAEISELLKAYDKTGYHYYIEVVCDGLTDKPQTISFVEGNKEYTENYVYELLESKLKTI